MLGMLSGMATLDRRVQVLFDEELYERLLAGAEADRMSVGAYIRQAVSDRIDRKRVDARTALTRLFAWADEHPVPAPTPEEWEQQKEELLDRPSVRDIA